MGTKLIIVRDNKKQIEEADLLQNKIYEAMPHKEWYSSHSFLEYVETGLKEPSAFLHYYEEGHLAAFSLLETLDEEDYLEFPFENLKGDILVQGPIMVDEMYRGKHLQRFLACETEKLAKESGYHYLCATVHPDNIVSLHNMLQCGYEIITTKQLHYGFRSILLKKIV